MNEQKNASSPKKLLLLEDDESMRELYQELFKFEGYHVQLAYDGADALQKLKTVPNKPHLIILDLSMPGMGGIEFLNRLKLEDDSIAKIPTVILSASEPKDLHNFPKERIMKKPAEIEKLLSLVKQLTQS